jgi:hypothetical protein
MTLFRLGGGLVTAAAALLLVTFAVALNGGSVSLLGQGPGSLALTVALALLGSGFLALAIGGRPPLDGRTVRAGLALVAIGVALAFATSGVSPSNMLIYVFLLGSFAVWLGTLVAAIGLLRSPGRARWVGLSFVGGALAALVAGAIANDPGVAFAPDAQGLRDAMSLVATVGAGFMLAGVAGVGVLGLLGGPGRGHEPGTLAGAASGE